MLGKKNSERSKDSVGLSDLTRQQSLPESLPTRKISQKSFSHELGPRGGIKASNLRARSYSDLKVLFFFFMISVS